MKDHSIPAIETSPQLVPLNQLKDKFLDIKEREAALSLERQQCQEEILLHFPPKTSGSSTTNVDDMQVKVEFKGEWKIVDLLKLKTELPEDIFTAITRTKYEVDVKPMKKFSESANYGPLICSSIQYEQKKPYVTIKPK